MPYEIFFKDESSDYREGVMLEEYNGILSLVAAQSSQTGEGTVYKKWGFPQDKEKQPISKAIPWKVRLGPPRQAVKMLEYFLGQLKKEPVERTQSQDDGIPF